MRTYEEELQSGREYAAKHFGIAFEDVAWYHSGSCYDRVGVKTLEAANIVTEKMKGQTANGGMFHGMPLGGHSLGRDGVYDCYC